MVLVGWLVGLAALVLLLLSVTGNGTGPAGVIPMHNVLWVWVLITLFAAAWVLLLRGLPWPAPLRHAEEGDDEGLNRPRSG